MVNKITKKTSQFKSNLEKAKNQSEHLTSLICHCEQELSRHEQFEQELNDREAQFKKRETSFELTIRDFEKKKQATVNDLTDRAERISKIEKKLSSSTTLKTSLGKNEDVELKVGGVVFSTTLVTLTSVKDTFFTCYFSDHFNSAQEQNHSIDRPAEHFHLILNHLRGIDIKHKIHNLSDGDLIDFIEEVVFYQITPIYDILPTKGKKHLLVKHGIELDGYVQFNSEYSRRITLESETRARCNSAEACAFILGTKSNSFKVKFDPNCSSFSIGFSLKRSPGLYLFYSSGALKIDGEGSRSESFVGKTVKAGSIVECLLDREKRNISYIVDGINYGIAFSNIPSSINEHLYPFILARGTQDCTFELLNE